MTITRSVNLDGGPWRKSSYSVEGNCLEVRQLAGSGIAMRNSKDPDRGILVLSRRDMAAFVQRAKAGEFDDLVLRQTRR